MAINFDSLPKQNPYNTPIQIDSGYYRAIITKAQMYKTRDQSSEYLGVTSDLFDVTGKKVAAFFDRFQDSDKPLLQFKLGRFVICLGLNIAGTMELKDLAKIIPGKEYALEIEQQEWNNTTSPAVKIFGSEGYWPLSAFDELTGVQGASSVIAAPTDDDLPFMPETDPQFNAADAEDY